MASEAPNPRAHFGVAQHGSGAGSSARSEEPPGRRVENQGGSPRHFVAVAMASATLVGLPLMVIVPQRWAAPLLAAAVIFPAVVIIAVLLRVSRATPIPGSVVIVGSSAAAGAIAGVLIFSPASYGFLGIIVCLPVAVAVAFVGMGLDRWFTLSRAVATVFLVVGAILLGVSSVMTVVQYT